MTFIGNAFGGYRAVVTAVVPCTGYIIAVASVVTICGGLAETILKQYLSITIPWQAISAVLSLGALVLIVAGAKPSTKVAAVLFAFQVLLLLVIALALLIDHSGYINGRPFNPSHLHRRTRPRSPKSIRTRAGVSPGRCSPAFWWSGCCTCFCPKPLWSASMTTPPH